MEEAGLGTTLPTQQWAGFERFKEVQEILDRNKCATPPLPGCLETCAALRQQRAQAAHQRNQREPRVEAVRTSWPGASASVVDAPLVLPAARREDLQRNVVLIRELNINIGKVVELYRELSVRCGAGQGALDRCVAHCLCLRSALSARLVTRRNDERQWALCFHLYAAGD
jgi:hypothetical protein